jgi:hypothetical protein
MQEQNKVIERLIKPTIKQRLLSRFQAAVTVLGEDWRKKLAENYPCFNTKEGVNHYEAVATALRDNRRASADRIEKVVDALEEIVNTQNSTKLKSHEN